MQSAEAAERRRTRNREYMARKAAEDPEKFRARARRQVNTPEWKEKRKKWVATPAGKLALRRAQLKGKYGMTLEEFDEMLAAQGGVCAVCGTDDPRNRWGQFAVDHCHGTGRVRGILCHPCNSSLGHAKDDPRILRALADYVERSQRCGD